MALEVNVRKDLGFLDLEASFTVQTGKLLVIVGPSGAGKTTIVRMIAGLEKPDHGFIIHNGEVWVDTARKIYMNPQRRFVGYVFQDYFLFPHLTVYRNVTFAAKEKVEAERLLKLQKKSQKV